MGKATYKGLVPRDDPMFLTGPELFSPPAYEPSSTASATDTAGVSLASPPSEATQPETEEDNKELGAKRLARMQHQNAQFRKKR